MIERIPRISISIIPKHAFEWFAISEKKYEAKDLLTDENLSAEIKMDYRYLFVDEYQDCSPIQVKIFDRLSELMEHSYWVGDYKQAIYGFRGSDTALTKAVADAITLKDGKEGTTWVVD